MPLSSLALQSSIWFRRCLAGEIAYGRRDSYPNGLKHLAADSLALGTDGELFAVFLNGNLLQGFEILFDVRPLEAVAVSLNPPVQFFFEDQSQKAAEHVAANRLIALMKHRTGLKEGLCGAKDVLHLPEFLVFQRHVVGTEFSVGSEHPLAVKTDILFDFFLVDRKSTLLTLDVAPKPAVSDQGLGSFLELLLKRCQYGLPVGLILPGLLRIEAHDVASAVDGHLLDLQGGGIFGRLPLGPNLPEFLRVREDLFSHLFHLAHSNPQDIGKPCFRIIEGFEGLLADHATVGHKAETSDLKTLANPLCYRNKRLHIRGVARPHLAANGSTAAVEYRPDDHLIEIRSMVLAIAPFSQSLSAFPFEIDGGRVEEDHIKPFKEMPLTVEEALFNKVFGAARGKRGSIVLVLHFLPEERHGPIEMMQGQIVCARDGVVPAPLLAEPVRTAQHEPVEYREEDRSFHVKAEEPVGQKCFEYLPYTQFFPQTLENQTGTDLFGVRQQVALPRENQQRLLREPGKGAHQAFDLTLGLETIQPTDGGNDPLGHLASLPVVLHYLQILMWTCLFGAHKHWSLHYIRMLLQYYDTWNISRGKALFPGTTFLTLKKYTPDSMRVYRPQKARFPKRL